MNNRNNQPVTNQELKNTLAHWSKHELKDILAHWSKHGLKDVLEKWTCEEISPIVSLALAEQTKKINSKLDKNHNKIINILDKQGKILEKLDKESAAHSLTYKKYDKAIKKHSREPDNHERRLQSLEPQPATI